MTIAKRKVPRPTKVFKAPPKRATSRPSDTFYQPPPDTGPFPMSMQKEMALAVILWRALRFPYTEGRKVADGKTISGVGHVLPVAEKVNDTAIEMATRMGVKKEFFEWLFEFPVFKLYMVGLESWPTGVKGLLPPEKTPLNVEGGASEETK